MADSSIISLSGAGNPKVAPSYLKARVDSSVSGLSVDPGTPVAPGNVGTGNTPGSGVIFAQAGGGGNSPQVIGLAVTAGEAPGSVNIQSSGFLSLTIAEWNNVTGNLAGLVPGDYYYASATAGEITNVQPSGSGQASLLVGYAISATTLLIMIGANAPQARAEHFTVNAAGTQAITPGIQTTFFTTGTGSGTAHATLANGAYDGEEKVFHMTGNAEVDADLTPASFGDGVKITFSNGAFLGAAILKWDAVTAKWWIVSNYLGTVS